MRSRALELEVKYDFEAQRLVAQAVARSGFGYDTGTQKLNTSESAEYAQTASRKIAQVAIHTSLSEFRFSPEINERQFLTEALERCTGNANFASARNDCYATKNLNGVLDNNSIDRSFAQKIDKHQQLDAKRENNLNGHERADISAADSKTAESTEKLSMNDLENAIRIKLDDGK